MDTMYEIGRFYVIATKGVGIGKRIWVIESMDSC